MHFISYSGERLVIEFTMRGTFGTWFFGMRSIFSITLRYDNSAITLGHSINSEPCLESFRPRLGPRSWTGKISRFDESTNTLQHLYQPIRDRIFTKV